MSVFDIFKALKSKEESEVPQYTFVERKVDDELIQVATRIQSGKYKDLIFSTGRISLLPKQNGEEGQNFELNYTYLVEHKPEGLEEGEDLNKIVGDIIMDALQKDIIGVKED